MSTRQQPTYDDATITSTRTDQTTTDFSTTTTDPGTTSASDTAPTDPSPADPRPHGDVPWTQRCKRQFDTTDATRMRNLNDDANDAMHDGV